LGKQIWEKQILAKPILGKLIWQNPILEKIDVEQLDFGKQMAKKHILENEFWKKQFWKNPSGLHCFHITESDHKSYRTERTQHREAEDTSCNTTYFIIESNFRKCPNCTAHCTVPPTKLAVFQMPTFAICKPKSYTNFSLPMYNCSPTPISIQICKFFFFCSTPLLLIPFTSFPL